MSKHIRVLLADDTLIAREGLRAVLRTVDEIRVVGEAVVIEEVSLKTQQLEPDVILLDLKWGCDKRIGLETIPGLKRVSPATRVIAVSAHDKLVASAREAGADGAISKTFSRLELLAAIRAVDSDDGGNETWVVGVESESLGYSEQLANLRSGQPHAKRYESLLGEVLPFLFEGHLTDFCCQCAHHGREEIWDLVAYNASSDPFWSAIRQQHRASQVLFELKNVSALDKGNVQQLVGYLGDPHIDLGLIVTRNAPTTGAVREARRAYRRNGVVVLILGDDEVLEMLRVRGRGSDPTGCLKRVYLELIRST